MQEHSRPGERRKAKMRHPTLRAALLAMGLLALLFPARANEGAAKETNWPSFRGPNARGIAEGYATPTTWNAEESKNVRWKTPIPGLGHSSPIVWGNRVFVTSAISGKEKDELKV